MLTRSALQPLPAASPRPARVHDPKRLMQNARQLRHEANGCNRNALLLNGAAWLGTAATLGMLGRFLVNRVLPMPFEQDMNRRKAVLYSLGAMTAGCGVQGVLLRRLQQRSENMALEASRMGAVASDVEQELRDMRPAPHACSFIQK